MSSPAVTKPIAYPGDGSPRPVDEQFPTSEFSSGAIDLPFPKRGVQYVRTGTETIGKCEQGTLAIEREFQVVATAGANWFPSPMGLLIWAGTDSAYNGVTYATPNWSECVAQRITLEVDPAGGTNFSQLAYSTDWNMLSRGLANEIINNWSASVPPTVRDLCIGFTLNTPATGGERYRFRWIERLIGGVTPVPRLVWSFNNGGVWEIDLGTVVTNTGTNPPNSFALPPIGGCVIEAWRWVRKCQATIVHPNGTRYRQGQRFLPYWRGNTSAAGPEFFVPLELAYRSGTWPNHQDRWRVCYRNLTTGAATPLCTMDLFSTGRGIGQRANAWVRSTRGAFFY